MFPSWVSDLLPLQTDGPDLLAAEREGSNVDSKAIARMIYGEEALEMRAKVEKVLLSKGFKEELDELPSLSRVDKMERSLARGKKLKKLRKEKGWSEEEYTYSTIAAGEANVYGLHDKAFIKCLTDQTTDEQKEAFLVPAKQDRIIGCYAQTELSHGSNVRGLETTATWSEDGFLVHSPSLTACKWWIGTLGRTANHALIMAQLIIKGKNYGPHTFVVRIRDDNHEPLPGIYVGDIGPKFGYASMDNGFCLFNKVKIPHLNMLARFQYIDQNGNYHRRGSPALVYGGMTYLRVGIALDAATTLARATTIATRYAAIRRQFKDETDEETQVLNYTMVQYRLLPQIANSYALFFATAALRKLYQRYDASDPPDERLLAALHVQSCAMKSYGTTISVEGLEVCRRACGGHGYSHYSGIGHLYAEMLPSVTYEGDNYMLTKQVARALLKTFSSQPASGIVGAFQQRVAFQVDQIKKLGGSDNALQINFWRLSTAYAQYLIVKEFDAAAKPHPVFDDLFQLHASTVLDAYAAEFADAGVDVGNGLSRQKNISSLLAKIRPHAVKLTDGWAFSDLVLNSSLGRNDGKAYESMFRLAASNPVNDLTFDPRPESDVIVKAKL